MVYLFYFIFFDEALITVMVFGEVMKIRIHFSDFCDDFIDLL